MRAKYAIGAYGIVTLVVLAFTQPERGILGGWLVLLTGPAGSMLLALQAIPEIYREDLSLNRHFSPEACAVFVGSMGLWIVGGTLLFRQFTSQKPIVYRAAFVVVFLFASSINIFLFALGGL